MRCPICKKTVEDRQTAEDGKNWFPFCGRRCSLIDLGRWLGDKYQIPVEDSPDFPPQEVLETRRHNGEKAGRE